ncbi:MAG: PspC domain-containing protein [Caldilineales bacterium]|nr:PspC domain-containing protein [Caldilineales bacterium]
MKRLYRSRTDRMLAGVCGGIGQYLNIDPTLIRLAFLILAIWGGGGIVAYLIAWIIIPEEPLPEGSMTAPLAEAKPAPPPTTAEPESPTTD